jgi:hypothetical protein
MDTLIKIVLENQSTLRSWKNDFKSEEWQQADELHFKMFGTHLNQTKNCGCMTDFYNALNSKHKIKYIMSKSNKLFLIKNDSIIQSHKFGIISNNSSDETFIAMLKVFPQNIDQLEKYPSDWEKLMNADVKEVTETETEQLEKEKEEIDTKLEDARVDKSHKEIKQNQREIELNAMTNAVLKTMIEETLKVDLPEDTRKPSLVAFIIANEA